MPHHIPHQKYLRKTLFQESSHKRPYYLQKGKEKVPKMSSKEGNTAAVGKVIKGHSNGCCNWISYKIHTLPLN